jgi:ERCC4-type nuclease
VSYNIPVLFTKNPRETAALLLLIAKKEREFGHADVQLHAQKPVSETEVQEFIVSSLPGVGPTLAKHLLTHFKTIQNIANASEEVLANVEKIGKKKAKEISGIFRKEYNAGESR